VDYGEDQEGLVKDSYDQGGHMENMQDQED
jgi:hypothetical protein